MIRRALVFVALVGVLVATPVVTASADPYVACAWNVHPLNMGLCVGV